MYRLIGLDMSAKLFPPLISLCRRRRANSNLDNTAANLLFRTTLSTATKPKVSAVLDESVGKDIENDRIKPRKHPGIVASATVLLPVDIRTAVKKATGDTPMKQLIAESVKLSRYLHSRQRPVERGQVYTKYTEISKQVHQQMGIDVEKMGSEEREGFEKELKDRVNRVMKERLYNWKPLDVASRHSALVYLTARAAPQYAANIKVFNSLLAKHKNFAPTTLFDFGSGIGTVSWAVQELWGNSVKEFYCVDSSSEMNGLAQQILANSADTRASSLRKTFYRQFLPASHERKYDLVVSSYSLLELPSTKTRKDTIINLWNKTDKYLVLVEYGTLAGFKALNEARDLILSLSESKNCNRSDQSGVDPGRVVAPCAHSAICPRITAADGTPCNFTVSYLSFPHEQKVKNELFSYLILKKGGEAEDEDDSWPRVVRPVLLRSRHVICRMCTAQGQLQQVIFTPTKHGKICYRCAKSTRWGDTIPVKIEQQKSDSDINLT